MTIKKTIIGSLSLAVFMSLAAGPVSASSTNGTINAVNRYAWSENAGWIDFGTSQGDVQITDAGLTGYAWGENVGWVSLNCSNDNSCGNVQYGVVNDGNGNLSGYAWTENAGWINFAPTGGGVTISSSGVFSGYAWGENVGWIVFNCASTNSCATVNYEVSTDWRSASARVSTTASVPASGPVVSVPASYAPLSSPPAFAPSSSPPSATTVTTSSLQVQLNALLQELATLQAKVATGVEVGSNSPSFVFTKNLKLFNTGSDVKTLQKFLNGKGFLIAETGSGSPGHETTFLA